MTSRIFALGILSISILVAPHHVDAQVATPNDSALNATPTSFGAEGVDSAAAFVSAPPRPLRTTPTYRPFSALGFSTRFGLAGTGFDVATPLAKRFNLRVGTDFFGYATTFQDEGANIGVNLHLRSSHAALDWFPFGGHFRVSPLLVFGNNNRVLATAIIPAGSTVTLNGQDFISSKTDPLRGSGRIDLHKVSPGLSFGFGNLVPRNRGRLSVPVEMGFYYVGQPSLQLGFTGSACDPNFPPAVGCQSVDQDLSFQQSLAAFKARSDNNLSYASFFPIFSVGVSYRIW